MCAYKWIVASCRKYIKLKEPPPKLWSEVLKTKSTSGRIYQTLVIRLSEKAPDGQECPEHPSALQRHRRLYSALLQIMRYFLCQRVVGVAWETRRRGSEDTSIAVVTHCCKVWVCLVFFFFKQPWSCFWIKLTKRVMHFKGCVDCLSLKIALYKNLCKWVKLIKN